MIYIHESCAPYLLGKDPLRINEHADNLLNWTANRYIGYPTRSVEYRTALGAADPDNIKSQRAEAAGGPKRPKAGTGGP